MTSEQIAAFRQLLVSKGYNEQQIDEIIKSLPIQIQENKPQENIPLTPQIIDPLEQFATKVLDNPAIQNLIAHLVSLPEKQAILEQEQETRFFAFLKKLDVHQKVYNILFMLIGCGAVYLLKKGDVIGNETATALATLIIGASLTDAISSYMKHKQGQ